ncbi:urokinase plasminogen activator surface receptor-like isoform X2 [Thunnus albacares]|uniref:urokinase plasminogen activator surface receptor-like isoform X2 n=1 Tax=Thunnus albacares TaxID=8236 RepID=UPI001CF60F34|nr:urokinase plasminogen activator surface receptor-like isoform X2 [Thunnus albacares]
MMKLILSLTLIWTLSSTAEALKCWHGEGTDTKQQILLPCNSTDLCVTVAYQGYGNGTFTQDTIRWCLPSSLFSEGKHTFSFNVGFASMAASVYVCNTDRCNSQVIPYSVNRTKNNLQCFTCDDPSSAVCDKAVQCVGEQDHCFSWTVEDYEDRPFHTFGCFSANLCEVAHHFEPLSELSIKLPKCCGSSFCNSAWSVKLNVIPLLFGLITLIVY